jgi:hypothetical protein
MTSCLVQDAGEVSWQISQAKWFSQQIPQDGLLWVDRNPPNIDDA